MRMYEKNLKQLTKYPLSLQMRYVGGLKNTKIYLSLTTPIKHRQIHFKTLLLRV